jgi:squalene-hopene/tetraprenyl-beta-curcumene cyclase
LAGANIAPAIFVRKVLIFGAAQVGITSMRMHTRVFLAMATALVAAITMSAASSWDPKLAAQYLDTRQKEWAAWAPAQSADGACVSCHTGMPYLLARPALRRLLDEHEPTLYESSLIARLESHAGAKPAAALQSVETIFAANFVAGAAQQKTFEQLFALQKIDGPLKGGWQWYNANLDPWETAPAFAYGSAMAALAIGSAPADIRNTPDAKERLRALGEYLQTGYDARPLHTRLAILWAAAKTPDLVTPAMRQATIAEILEKQQPDGGWTLESLGPWAEHAAAPPSLAPGASHAYATAFTTFVLQRAAGASLRSRLGRATAWLRDHQDRQTGAWPAVSMNKKYPAGSMEEKFLQDAATGFAVAALLSP